MGKNKHKVYPSFLKIPIVTFSQCRRSQYSHTHYTYYMVSVAVAVTTIFIYLFSWKEEEVCIPLPPLPPTTPTRPSSLSILYLLAKTHKHNNTFFCCLLMPTLEKQYEKSLLPPFRFSYLQSSIQKSSTITSTTSSVRLCTMYTPQ